ncbi:nitroreductase/dihydropteridine reductase [Pedobacter sp. UYP30]|uniref:NAD(P)H-dependent oxidoreductase n=1 Tax=Pedobacter sp. UYP30 TaxID=1756400 RepID=UPI0033984424
MNLIEDLNWRYATKKMNGKLVPQEKLEYILKAARLAPSSSGLQPFKIIVVSDREKLAEIRKFSFDQSQITDCSHLLVFAAWDGYSNDRMGKSLAQGANERGLPEDSVKGYQNTLWGMYEPLGQEWHQNHSAKQAYISLGIALVAAAEQKVDATPMEGFQAPMMDDFLGLKELGLKSAVIMAIGYRDEENDWLVNLKKVRTPEEEFFIEM